MDAGPVARRAHVYAENLAEPEILAHALMHHLLEQISPTMVALVRTYA